MVREGLSEEVTERTERSKAPALCRKAVKEGTAWTKADEGREGEEMPARWEAVGERARQGEPQSRRPSRVMGEQSLS